MSKDVLNTITKYWDDTYEDFDKRHDTENISKWEENLRKLLGNESKNVLDLGTGTGFLANIISNLGHTVIGVDISKNMLKKAKENAIKVNSSAIYMNSNIEELPFEENSFDFIVNSRLLWTIINPQKVIKEWIRVLKPGGKIYSFSRMTENKDMPDYEFIYDGIEKEDLPLIKAKKQELIDLYKKNGLEKSEIIKLPGLTRDEFDYEEWFVLKGEKSNFTIEKAVNVVAEFWNNRSYSYEDQHLLLEEKIWKKYLSQILGEEKDIHILDLATGTGILSNMMGEIGYSNIVGMDISEKMMDIGRENAKLKNSGVKFVYGNALDIPLEGNSVDVITSCRLIWTLLEPEKAINEWKRVVKPHGKIIAIQEMHDEKTDYDWTHHLYGENVDEMMKLKNATKEELIKLFKNAGLKNVKLINLKGCKSRENDEENWCALIGYNE